MSTFLPQDSNDNPIPVLRLKDSGAHSILSSTGASARNVAAFDGETRVVSVYSDTGVYLRFGDVAATASSSDHYYPAGVYYDFALGGDKTAHSTHLAVLAVDTSGTVYVSEKQ